MRNRDLILGIGSNQGCAIENLRRSLAQLKKSRYFRVLDVASIYESDALLKEGAPPEWNQKYLNSAIHIELQNTLSLPDVLTEIKKIEQMMGREESARWAPRVIDIDILWARDTQFESESLCVPHRALFERPFALIPLLELVPSLRQLWKEKLPPWASERMEKAPLGFRLSSKFFWPRLVGILNVTPDSFSDGGRYIQEEAILKQAERLTAQGAEILDLGAESTRPRAQGVLPDEECRRLDSALTALAQMKMRPLVSLDCRNASVVEKIIEKHKIDFLNDVTGFANFGMQRILSESALPAFVMHSLAVPPREDQTLNVEENPAKQLCSWWSLRCDELIKQKINVEKLIFDPGIGFGKTRDQNFWILNNLNEFSQITHDIMIGHSRKSFLSAISDKPASERDPETAMVTRGLNLAFVQYLRIHDMESQKAALGYRSFRD